MKLKPENNELNINEINVKKRRKRKITLEDEGASSTDGNVKEMNESSDTSILKRNSPSKGNGVVKKRKEKCESDSLGMSKTSEQNAKIKDSKSIQSTECMDNDEEDDKNINNQLDGKSMKAAFNSINSLEYLQQFVKSCNDNKERDMAAEYLNAGGNILELLRLLDSTDKKGIGSATTVFSAVRILLIKIMAEYPQYQSSAEGACRHLINSHLPLVHSMLSFQSNAKQRKIILQLLAAVVSLGRSLPRELLTHLSLQPEVVKSLIRQTKPTDNQNIRNCFIHFILAFLIEGNVSTIRALLNKHDLLSSIFPDLIYDSKDIVALVVTTLKIYILQNSKISKTMKLHIFSTSVIQNLVYLYNWKGPNNWPGNKTHISSTEVPQYLEEKKAVNEIVHDFLIVLLTSHRYGIVFHDHSLGTSHIKHNQLANTILQSLDRPWEHDKPFDLVIRILTACPDLIKSQLTLLEQHIEPKVSIKWITAMKFVREIIISLDAEGCFKTCSLELNVSQLASAVMSLTVSGIVIKHAILPSLTYSNMLVRHEAVITLITMFNQIQKFLLVAKMNYKGHTDFDTFKNCILEYILKNIPNLNMILDVWNDVFTPKEVEHDSISKEYIPELKKEEHLAAILNLLHIYHEICPKLLHTLLHVPATTFLNPLHTLQDIDVIELNAIRVKTIQFLVILNPAEFSPQKKVFSDALSFLLSLLNNEDSFNVSSIKSTIKMLLNITGMFEGCSDQLDIWINGFINLNGKQEIVDWFVRLSKKVAKNMDRYVDEIIKTDEIVSEGVIYAGRIEDVFSELMDKNIIRDNLENDVLHMQRFTSISPLLCCMLHKMTKNLDPTILSYASYVLVHTLHYQTIPQCIIHFTKDIQDLPVQKYLQSWSRDNDPIYVEEVTSYMDLICKLNRFLLDNTSIQISEVFGGNNTVTFTYNNEIITIYHSLSAYEIMYLFKMTVFYLTQFAERGLLSTTQISKYKILLISLLYLAKENPDDSTLVEECAKSVFAHPVILHYFSPLHQKSKDLTLNMITLTVLDICKEMVHLYRKCNIRTLVSHFRNKLLMQLHKMIDNHRINDNTMDVETIVTLLGLLQLTIQDVMHLLKKLMQLENSMFISKDGINLSLYGYITPKLLELISINKNKSQHNSLLEFDVEFVKCLCSHLLILKSKEITNIEMWESALHEYISKFPFNIAGIDTDMFSSLLSTKIEHTTVKLLSFLISKNIKFIPIFTEYMLKSDKIKESGIVFPIIANNLNFKWSQEFIQKLKIYYEAEILSYLCNPRDLQIWIEENVNAVLYFIKNAFDLKNCSEICNTILHTGDKLDMVSIQYIQILESVYKKCATLDAGNEKFIMQLLQVLLHITTLTLKKESKNMAKLVILCEKLNDTVKHLQDMKENFVFETISSNHSWLQFSRFSLKLGLKELKNNKRSLPILKTLSALCNIAYKADSDNENAKTLFEMTVSHSEFLNIMLESSNAKRDLVELLWILMQKNKTVIALAHVPVYLAAYNATLSKADQYLLLILQYYENNNVNIYEYQPYLWGNAAAVHYSVKSEIHLNLWKQPSTTQVLNLFDEDVINNTIQNYPVNRALKTNELHICETYGVYDPAFYLPLLCYSLSENNVVSCLKIAQSGALALAFVACSSNHSDVRMAAYTIIARYYTHLEGLSSKTKLLRMRLIDALRYGIATLDSRLDNMRLNCLVSIFFARTSLIATQPLHPLYSRLQIFLMAKPALDVNAIPELLQLFHSSDIEHKAHRRWILENIRDGMKTQNELDVAFKCVLFKMLLDFYTCNLSDFDSKKLILEIICVVLKMTKAAILLMKGHGLLPWLLNIATNLRDHEVQYLELIIKIIDALLNTILKMEEDTIHYKIMLLNISLSLKSHLSKDIKIAVFILYVNVLQKLFLSKHMQTVVPKERLMEILEFSKKLLGDIDECEDILSFGCEYVTKVDCSKNDNEIEVAKNSLRTMVWTWCSHEMR
ncbi:nucleolar pre-ribosomal-associated protein 1 [Halictus rubicundus]|uniref:nucleolar pre-ribosomal-associated protein 1 n=1 Tax=Halictus rubicundus TaxID=77578 RepID=UPI00403726B1